MKIGFVLDDSLDRSDGVQQYVLALGRWFSDHGHEVHYLVGETKRTDLKNVHVLSKNISVNFNQNSLTVPRLASRSNIKTLLKQEKFDVLHVQMPFSPLLAGRVIVEAPSSTAIVGTFHILFASRIAEYASRSLGVMQRRSLKRIDAAISVSAPAQAVAKAMYGLKSSVIPNPVNVSEFAKGTSMKRFTPRTNVVFMGRLVKRKGAEQLIRAFAAMQSRENVQLLVAGKGPLGAKLETLASTLGISDQVTFLGFIEESDKKNLLATADIAVFPSTGGESFGIVLIEAMAAGAGVVLAGNNPGYVSVMTNREAVINPLDTRGFAAKLDELVMSPNKRKRIHGWQQKHVQQYDIEVVSNAVLSVYELALLSRRKVR